MAKKSLKNGETLVKTEWSELQHFDIAKFGSHGDWLYMVNVYTFNRPKIDTG